MPRTCAFASRLARTRLRQQDDTTLEFEGRMRVSYDDELKCDPYNRTGRLTRGKR